MRYWDFENAAVSDLGDIIGVDAYYFDGELFQNYDLCCHSSVEFSLGVRYADFTQLTTEFLAPGDVVSAWQGWGGTAAIEGRRRILCGDLYARGRLSVLVGDGAVSDRGIVVARCYAEGNTVTQVELAIGYEVSGYVGPALLSARIGAEWQQWSNVAMADGDFGGIGEDDVLEDAGWAGVVIGFGIQI
jgi:hypothetical protein